MITREKTLTFELIVAIEGGGFSLEKSPCSLITSWKYEVRNALKCPKVCFVPTATGYSEGYVLRFGNLGWQTASPTDLQLLEIPTHS